MVSNSSTASATTLHTPFCRKKEVAEIIASLQHSDCSAVFLYSEMGLGATSLLRELTLAMAEHGAVISLHGTPSLAAIPFGILAPYIRRRSSSFVRSHVDAIRQVLALFDEQEHELRLRLGNSAVLNRPLLIIDEADHLDAGTAELAANLAQAGKIKIVVAHRAASRPVDPLPRLWDAGLAEKFHLRPLSRRDAHDFCTETLGGQVTDNTSWYFWNTAGGNPLLMRLVIEEALVLARLVQRNNVWVMDLHALPAGHQLKAVVQEQLRGLSPAARKTLDLVALSEPVTRETVTRQVGGAAINDLFERRLLQETSEGSGVLRLASPIYGEVLREMVPHSQSQLMHSQLVSELDGEPSTPEALLRITIWTLESGRHVPDGKLLTAAIFACKLYESGIALRLAQEVTGDAASRKAQSVMARAKYNMGEYQEAAALLQHDEADVESISELLFGALLRTATRSAVGQSAQAIHDDAQQLRHHGERLARENPEQAEEIVWLAKERADVLDLMAYSRTGDYAAMVEPIQRVLSNTHEPDNFDHVCNRSLALAFDAERLSAQGFSLNARERAAAAFAIDQREDHTVYFVPEMIITRAQVAALTAGEWDEAEQILQYVSVDVGKATISFGGSVGVVRGMAMLRQGKFIQALEVLLQGLDALHHSDPQQLFGFCVSMAAFAAAKTGKSDLARELLKQYREDAGMFIVVAHERAFVAAAREHLDGDGSGQAELLRIADDSAARGLLGAELNALSLALEFDPHGIRQRLLSAALKVQGRWAAGLAAYAVALGQRQATIAVTTAEQLLEAQMYHHAGKSLKFASSLLTKDHMGRLRKAVYAGLERVEQALGDDHDASTGLSHNQRRTRELLTARELEISLMAAQGMTDKAIAAQLHVSVRTVEGHLYRSYAKLRITDRNDLAVVLSI